ncbi:MAG: hypothetical protein GVY30_00125 [Chloroflexi bacterium]|jgi:ABC-type uncharacterized transport system YnjBCD permease subunit|nr:hypothetical protein [Chloroflexota bacterium]
MIAALLIAALLIAVVFLSYLLVQSSATAEQATEAAVLMARQSQGDQVIIMSLLALLSLAVIVILIMAWRLRSKKQATPERPTRIFSGKQNRAGIQQQNADPMQSLIQLEVMRYLRERPQPRALPHENETEDWPW